MLATEYRSFFSSGWVAAVFRSNRVVGESAIEELPSTLNVGEGSIDVLAPKSSAKLPRSPVGVKVEATGDSLGASRILCVIRLAVEAVVNGSELQNTEEMCPLRLELGLTGTGRRVNAGGKFVRLTAQRSGFCSVRTSSGENAESLVAGVPW